MNDSFSIQTYVGSFLLIAATAMGCGSDPATTADAAVSGDASVANGAALSVMYGCQGCHTASDSPTALFAGQITPRRDTTAVYSQNLTPDMMTGIGSWTTAQIVTAILDGRDEGGGMLCPQMPRYRTGTRSLTEAQARDIAAYLKSLPAVSRMIPHSMCP
jgi:mono/diheme cytochrome c family protein